MGEREAQWRRDIRTALHVSDDGPDLGPRTHSVFCPTEGVRAERVSYGTQFGMRIPGILYLPDPMPVNGEEPVFSGVNPAKLIAQKFLVSPKGNYEWPTLRLLYVWLPWS